MNSTDDDNATYELFIKFVVVRSVGGRYDDDAYAAGWEMGAISAALETATLAPWDYQPVSRTMRVANVAQAHAVARAYGLKAEVTDISHLGGDVPLLDGWCVVEFRREAAA